MKVRELIAAAYESAALSADDALLAENKRQATEIASLRLTLGDMPHNADMPEPIGCPMPGACACRVTSDVTPEGLDALARAAAYAERFRWEEAPLLRDTVAAVRKMMPRTGESA